MTTVVQNNTAEQTQPTNFDGVKSGKILIVDDIAVNVKVTRAHLEAAGFANCAGVTDATDALRRIRSEQPDVVLLDIMMPVISGLDILREIRNEPDTERLPVLIITGTDCRELKKDALQLGATDFLSKPIDVDELIPRVRNALAMKSYEDDLKALSEQRIAELEQSQREIIHCLARAAEFRDNETGSHVVRVGQYAGIIADELGLAAETVELVTLAATLHDVGKIGVPDAILRKPDSLDDDETAVMQRHCGFGRRVLQRAFAVDDLSTDHTSMGAQIMDVSKSPALAMARTIALTHHERWDGTGYPLGLSGEQIPIEGRITAVADVFDALRSRRPYKEAFPLEKSLDIMREESGSHFDPTIVDAFLRRTDDIVEVQIKFADV